MNFDWNRSTITRLISERFVHIDRLIAFIAVIILCVCSAASRLAAQDPHGQLLAGAAKVDITNEDAGPVNDRLHVRALVLKSGQTTAVIVTVDAVAIGEIGPIKNDYLPKVRAALKSDLGMESESIVINASHCHGIVCADVDARTIQAVKEAVKRLVPVKVGVGRGREDRIMENRRLKLKSGREVDVRHAYSMPPDDEVAELGPVDPDIGILRLNQLGDSSTDQKTVAVVYNFACHPIQGVPSKGNTADITGFSSAVIEENLSDGAIALFVQGCGGDINPVLYKDVEHPRDAQPLGNLLGLSTLRALKSIPLKTDSRLQIVKKSITLPRADVSERIAGLESEQSRLVQSLNGTSLSLKTFLPLAVKYNISPEFPSYYSHRYLADQKAKRDDWAQLDAENRKNMKQYIANIQMMEQLARNQTNLALLRKHQSENVAAGKRTIDVEISCLRVGDFVMVTFPGELTTRIGLNIKQKSPHSSTFVAGYTNGYIYYAPTAEQLLNVGYAQEDSDCILAPEWQAIFEQQAAGLLQKI